MTEKERNDLLFVCYMIERIARKVKRRNKEIVDILTGKEVERLYKYADVLHSENPRAVEDDIISSCGISNGEFSITDVDKDFTPYIPSDMDMGKVYQRLIEDTMQPGETPVQAVERVYKNPICEVIDDYNNGAFYEPSYVIARAYDNGGF